MISNESKAHNEIRKREKAFVLNFLFIGINISKEKKSTSESLKKDVND